MHPKDGVEAFGKYILCRHPRFRAEYFQLRVDIEFKVAADMFLRRCRNLVFFSASVQRLGVQVSVVIRLDRV